MSTPTNAEIRERHDFAQKEYSEVRKTTVHKHRGILLDRLEEATAEYKEYHRLFGIERKARRKAEQIDDWNKLVVSSALTADRLEAAESLAKFYSQKAADAEKQLSEVRELANDIRRRNPSENNIQRTSWRIADELKALIGDKE